MPTLTYFFTLYLELHTLYHCFVNKLCKLLVHVDIGVRIIVLCAEVQKLNKLEKC